MSLPRRAFRQPGPKLRPRLAPKSRVTPNAIPALAPDGRTMPEAVDVPSRGGGALEAEVGQDAPRDEEVGDRGDELASPTAVLAAHNFMAKTAYELGPTVAVREASDGASRVAEIRDRAEELGSQPGEQDRESRGGDDRSGE